MKRTAYAVGAFLPIFAVLVAGANRAPAAARAPERTALPGEPCPSPSPTPVCLRTCPPGGPRWEIHVTYKARTVDPPANPYGGCFGAVSEVNCYLNNHVMQKGTYQMLPAEDQRCFPNIEPCLHATAPGMIEAAIARRTQ